MYFGLKQPVPFHCLACGNATNRFLAELNTCWNLTLNGSAAATDVCSCWTAGNLSADLATVKSCDCKSFFLSNSAALKKLFSSWLLKFICYLAKQYENRLFQKSLR
jgi:hypothetical protein